MKLSFGKKIIGIVSVLLVFMLIAALTSVYLISKVNDELRFVAYKKLPFSHKVIDIVQLIEEQNSYIRRLAEIPMDEKKFKPEWKTVEILHDEIEQKFKEARELLEIEEDTHSRIVEKKLHIHDSFDYIRQEYVEFTKYAHEIAELIKQGDKEQLQNLYAHYNAFETQFEEHFIHFRNTVEAQAILSVKHTEGDERTAILLNIILTILGAISGYLLSLFFTNRLTETMRRLVGGIKEVEKGQLDISLPVTTRDEVGYLTQSFNAMIMELKLKERIRETFGKYMDPRVVGALIEHPEITNPGGNKREMTVMFIDLKGFTTISERVSPSELVELINEFLNQMTDAIAKNHGVVDKFIGDAVMAYWGEPFNTGDTHANLACDAAIDAIRNLEKLNHIIATDYKDRLQGITVDLRIGIASGDIIVGTIGSEHTKSFTVLGDPVNLASRLEGLNKVYQTRILISDRTHTLLKGKFPLREIDLVRVMGKKNPQTIYEVREGCDPSYNDLYTKALYAYYREDWKEAQKLFSECQKMDANDKAPGMMMERITVLVNAPEKYPEWDGAWNYDSK